ncbi:MAG TPA: hypothetical protein PLX23_01960 [Candidatus Hydrogenedens sp.]|nr:hypothetical protein [Candidatus Hydrogenedens sp.]
MNIWVEKSIELSKNDFYLDNLLDIYPPDEISRELVVEEEATNLNFLFYKKNCLELVKELIRLKELDFKFPMENPYISFLSYSKEAIDKNPKTIKKICDDLYKMDYNTLKEKLEAPKKASRRIGPMFRNWLKKKYKFMDTKNFDKINEIVFLNGGDRLLKNYVIKQLGCVFRELSKWLDFIVKVKNCYIIGIAKFITDFGRTQTNQFNEAISLIRETEAPENVIKIAIVDGVAWRGGKMFKILSTLENNEFCLSVLLLEDFLNNMKFL